MEVYTILSKSQYIKFMEKKRLHTELKPYENMLISLEDFEIFKSSIHNFLEQDECVSPNTIDDAFPSWCWAKNDNTLVTAEKFEKLFQHAAQKGDFILVTLDVPDDHLFLASSFENNCVQFNMGKRTTMKNLSLDMAKNDAEKFLYHQILLDDKRDKTIPMYHLWKHIFCLYPFENTIDVYNNYVEYLFWDIAIEDLVDAQFYLNGKYLHFHHRPLELED